MDNPRKLLPPKIPPAGRSVAAGKKRKRKRGRRFVGEGNTNASFKTIFVFFNFGINCDSMCGCFFVFLVFFFNLKPFVFAQMQLYNRTPHSTTPPTNEQTELRALPHPRHIKAPPSSLASFTIWVMQFIMCAGRLVDFSSNSISLGFRIGVKSSIKLLSSSNPPGPDRR